MNSTEMWTAPKIKVAKSARIGRALTMVTAYDATQARWCARSRCDFILVGDSLGMVIQGGPDTTNVTVDAVEYHTRAVRCGAPEKFVIADLPFGSYQVSIEDGVRNSVRLMRAGASAVKLEGAGPWLPLVERLTATGIPVFGHLGLTPQSIHQFGGFKLQAKNPEEAERLIADAQALEKCGCIGIVLEVIPRGLAAQVTRVLSVPTIGIGAGADTDGQVLVMHDLLGMNQEFSPKFVKRYAEFEALAVEALNAFCGEVADHQFPSETHSFRGE